MNLVPLPLPAYAVPIDLALPGSALPQAETALIDANAALRTGIRILVIIIVAIVLRAILHRSIRRLTMLSVDGRLPAMRKLPLGRARKAIVLATGLVAERRRQRAETMRSVLSSVVSILIFTIAVMLVLGELGINLGPILASAGIVGVALGFGAQNLVKDYLNGICIILEDQYGVGDTVDIGEAIGTVEGVGLRTTQLRDAEGVVWYVRNGEIIRVANKSQGTATVLLDIPVAHGTDIDRARQVMSDALEDMSRAAGEDDIFVDPPEVQGVQSVTAVGITLRAVLSVVPKARYSAARDAKQRITEAFRDSGISAPAVSFRRTPLSSESEYW